METSQEDQSTQEDAPPAPVKEKVCLYRVVIWRSRLRACIVMYCTMFIALAPARAAAACTEIGLVSGYQPGVGGGSSSCLS